MIEVHNLTKRYGNTVAVDGLSIMFADNYIYGFLGPNGAGKSTTLNIITGCLAADAGEVLIDGYDILRSPRAAKRQIGYLPEQPPLYDDMTPTEYLMFVGEAKGQRGAALHAAVDAAMQKTGIFDVKQRLIRNLSKGYQQRVGIAQAILGNPKTVILDEPTAGLDPIQVAEMRELIRVLGHSHTVIFSSHILSEVSALCDHVLILSHGKLMAEDTPENLAAHTPGTYRIAITVRGEPGPALAALSMLKGTSTRVLSSGTNESQLLLDAVTDIREKIPAVLAASHVPLLGMALENATLEDVFLELTRSEQAEMREKEGH